MREEYRVICDRLSAGCNWDLPGKCNITNRLKPRVKFHRIELKVKYDVKLQYLNKILTLLLIVLLFSSDALSVSSYFQQQEK